MSSDDALDALLANPAGAVPEPGPAGEDAAVASVTARFAVKPRRHFAWMAAAALLLVGLGLGFLWGRNGQETDPAALMSASAMHERRVFDEVRRSLGEELAWLASNEGQITLGLTRDAPHGELRVVFLELRDAAGHTWARPRVVVPDGAETEIRLAGLPTLHVRATRKEGEKIEVRCRLAFEDGALLAVAPTVLDRGRLQLLGRTEAHDGSVALHLSVD